MYSCRVVSCPRYRVEYIPVRCVILRLSEIEHLLLFLGFAISNKDFFSDLHFERLEAIS